MNIFPQRFVRKCCTAQPFFIHCPHLVHQTAISDTVKVLGTIEHVIANAVVVVTKNATQVQPRDNMYSYSFACLQAIGFGTVLPLVLKIQVM